MVVGWAGLGSACWSEKDMRKEHIIRAFFSIGGLY